MAASMSNDPTRTACSATTPPREIERGLRRAAADVDDHVADGLVDRQPGADGRGHRLLEQLRVGRAGPAGGLGDGPALDLGDRRRHADHDPGPVEPGHAGPLEQQPDHALGDVEVGDRALPQRPHGDDVAGRPPDHLPRLLAHRQHVAGAAVEGDDRRLVEHDARAPARRRGCWRCRGRWPGREPGRHALRGPRLRRRRARPSPRRKCVDARAQRRRLARPAARARTTRAGWSAARRAGTRAGSPASTLTVAGVGERAGPRAPTRRRPPTARASRSAPWPSARRCRTGPPRRPSARCGRGHDHHHRRLADRDRADLVQQHHPADVGPAGPHLLGDGREPGLDLLLVGLVLELGDVGAARRSGRGPCPLKSTTAPQCGPHRPVGGGSRRVAARRRGQPTYPPSAAGAWALMVRAWPRGCWRGTPSVVFAAVPGDEDDDDDASVFGPPLPPDDRLWRHPSELNWGKPPATQPAPRSSRPWFVAFTAGALGAVLAVGVVALVHGLQPADRRAAVRADGELGAHGRRPQRRARGPGDRRGGRRGAGPARGRHHRRRGGRLRGGHPGGRVRAHHRPSRAGGPSACGWSPRGQGARGDPGRGRQRHRRGGAEGRRGGVEGGSDRVVERPRGGRDGGGGGRAGGGRREPVGVRRRGERARAAGRGGCGACRCTA